MKNIFTKQVTQEVIERIENLSANSQPNWGKMSVGQMLAHCCVTYEMVYTDKHPKPNAFTKELMPIVTQDLSLWEHCIWITGGLIEQLKTEYSLMVWTFESTGAPQLTAEHKLLPNTVVMQ